MARTFVPILGATAAFLYLSSARRRATSSETTLLLLSVNEGKKPVPLRLQKAAVQWALRDMPAVHGVLVARQEASSEKSWQEAVRDAGFTSSVADVHIASGVTRLEVYGQDSELRMQEEFVVQKKATSDKGGAVVVLEHQDNVLCLGGFHLDGNKPQHREVPLLDAMVRSAAGAAERGANIHATVFVGDMNFPISTEYASNATAEESQAAALGRTLASQAAGLRGSDQKDALAELGKETTRDLQALLASAAGRQALLETLDSCPDSLSCSSLPRQSEVAAGPSELQLCSMEPGSFPTYRLSNKKGRCLDALASAFAAQSKQIDDPGIWPLWPDLELPPQCIKHCFFTDKKAGVLKKRGDMVRLNLGWMDRLYHGVRPDEPVELEVRPGTPALLWDPGEMGLLDHAIVSWRITLRRKAA